MSTTKELLVQLESKVTGLLTKFNEAQVSLAEKTSQIELLNNQLEARGKEMELLKMENEKLKNVQSSEEKEDIKVKIGEMVKEIDKCISLLKV